MTKRISFLRGVPAEDALDMLNKPIANAYSWVLNEFGTDLLQYKTEKLADFNGFVPLKNVLAERHEIKEDPNDRVICSNGGMEMISLLFKSLNYGSTIATEEYTYDRVLQDAKNRNFKVIGVKNTILGICNEDLRRLLERNPDVKLFYQIIYHQNPLGITPTADNINANAKICAEKGVLYVCDVAYEDLRYDGKSNFKIDLSADTYSSTAPVGSFTKTVSPGTKCGYGIFPNSVVRSLAPIIANTRLNPNYPTQAAIWYLIKSGQYDELVQKIRSIYGIRLEALKDSIIKYLPQVNLPDITGGFFTLIHLRNISDAAGFVKSVGDCGVDIEEAKVSPQEIFGKSPHCDEAITPFRLTFPAVSAADIKEGVRIISEVYSKN